MNQREIDRKNEEKWPDAERFFTYVNPAKIRSTYPGFTFIKAGYEKVGLSKSKKLVIMAKEVKK